MRRDAAGNFHDFSSKRNRKSDSGAGARSSQERKARTEEAVERRGEDGREGV